MSIVSIHLDDNQARRLDEAARRIGLTAEELAARLVLEGLDRPAGDEQTDQDDAAFEQDLDYVLAKNAELYRRLAQ